MSIIIVPCTCESYKELLLAEAIFNKLYGKIHLKVYKKLFTIDETQLVDAMNKAKYEIIKKIRDIQSAEKCVASGKMCRAENETLPVLIVLIIL